MKRVAVFDVGSNSVRMMVADWDQGTIDTKATERRVTRLFSGMSDGFLAQESIARTAQAIAEFADVAKAMGAEKLVGFGTSSMRDGKNSDALIRLAAEQGVHLTIMSGEEEAQLAYEGVAPGGLAGVLDIGGGSTELIVGEEKKVRAGFSANVGAVRMHQQTAQLQPSPRVLIGMAREAMERVADLNTLRQAEQWIGVGGTVTTLAAMLLQLEPYDPEKVHGVKLTARATQSFMDLLWAMPVHLRKQMKGLDPQRADIIHCGTAILLAFFELTGTAEMEVSTQDNLVGFIRKYMASDL